MTRHEVREAAFLSLFQFAFFEKGDERDEQIRLFLEEDQGFPSEVCKEIEERLYELGEHLSEVDAAIEGASENWKLNRMNKVDLAILRLATFEMRFEGLDAGIAINEAVELAKAYGTDESGSFVNGILGRIARA